MMEVMRQSAIVIPTNILNVAVGSVRIYHIVAMEVNLNIHFELSNFNLYSDMLQMLTAPTHPMRSIVRTRRKFARACQVYQYGVATQRHALWIHGKHLSPHS